MANHSTDIVLVSRQDVEEKMIQLRGQYVILDRDVAALYGVETKRINEAVKNNLEKFPSGYVLECSEEESVALRSKISTLEDLGGVGQHSKFNYKAFTERGLYMLATILKGKQAVQTTIAIIETYAAVRELARTMEALQDVADGGEQQKTLLQKTGEMLADVIGHNLSTESTETEIELNFAVVKIKHKVIRNK